MNLWGLRALSSDCSCVLIGKAKSDLELRVQVGGSRVGSLRREQHRAVLQKSGIVIRAHLHSFITCQL